jgi:ethanolamine utilization microcompartment shell protein EutS
MKKYPSKKRKLIGGRRKSKKKIIEDQEGKQEIVEEVSSKNNHLEDINVDLPVQKSQNLKDINDNKLLIDDKEIDLITQELPSLKFNKSNFDLLNIHPEKPSFYDTLNKNTIKVLDREKKGIPEDENIQLNLNDQPIISKQDQQNQTGPSDIFNPNEESIIEQQVQENQIVSSKILNPNEQQLIEKQAVETQILSQEKITPNEQDIIDQQLLETEQNSQLEFIDKKRESDYFPQNVGSNFSDTQSKDILSLSSLNNDYDYSNENSPLPAIQSLENDNFEIDKSEKKSHLYLQLRDLKIIKIMNDSEIFCHYCANQQVSKRDVIAAINSNYYRVIENINRKDNGVKINKQFNDDNLVNLINTNIKMKWSKVSLNLLKKFYVYLSELII